MGADPEHADRSAAGIDIISKAAGVIAISTGAMPVVAENTIGNEQLERMYSSFLINEGPHFPLLRSI